MDIRIIVYITLILILIISVGIISRTKQEKYSPSITKDKKYQRKHLRQVNPNQTLKNIPIYHPTAAKNNDLSTSSSKSCPQMFPPGPDSMPPSAYSKLIQPEILSSAYNPPYNGCTKEQQETVGCPDYNAVKYACNSPWNHRCKDNDACASNSIGEKCEGPQGNMYCVCESVLKEGVPHPKEGQKVPKDDVIVSYGGVCTEDKQCCTGYCASQIGIFSKMCLCPDGKYYNDKTQQCECPEGTHYEYKEANCIDSIIPQKDIEAFQCTCPEGYIFDNKKKKCIWNQCSRNEPALKTNKAVDSSVGMACRHNNECSLGEECTGDQFYDIDSKNSTPYGYCRSRIGDPTKKGEAYKILGRGNCTEDSQCAYNTKCIKGTCGCDTTLGQYYAQDGLDSGWCKCDDSEESIDPLTGKCANPYKFKTLVCPNSVNVNQNEPTTIPQLGLIKGKFCNGNNDCGLGENCNLTHRICVCNSDVHTEKIFDGGICNTTDQCEDSMCIKDKNSNVKVCSKNNATPYQLAIAEYTNV